MKLKILVTEDIIKKAQFCGTDPNEVPMNCAVALAIRDIFPFAKVRNSYVAVSDQEWEYIGNFTLPYSAQLFITRFDSLTPEERLTLDPVTFTVEIPNKIIEAIGISEVERILSESKTLERV